MAENNWVENKSETFLKICGSDARPPARALAHSSVLTADAPQVDLRAGPRLDRSHAGFGLRVGPVRHRLLGVQIHLPAPPPHPQSFRGIKGNKTGSQGSSFPSQVRGIKPQFMWETICSLNTGFDYSEKKTKNKKTKLPINSEAAACVCMGVSRSPPLIPAGPGRSFGGYGQPGRVR